MGCKCLFKASSFPRRRESTNQEPQVKLQSLGISGVDASLRWHDEHLKGMDAATIAQHDENLGSRFIKGQTPHHEPPTRTRLERQRPVRRD